MESNREKVSYCIGLETGSNIKRQFKELDASVLLKGFKDALDEKKPELELEEIQHILGKLQEQMQVQQKQFVEELGHRNKEEGEKYLEENKGQEGVQVLSSGLQYKVLEEGSGATPGINDVVTVNYRGTFIDGRTFDSTYERNKPAEFPVSRVIPGWTEALKLMKEGAKWQIVIPSYLAYGENGYGPEIEPNKTLIFEMELLKVVPA